MKNLKNKKNVIIGTAVLVSIIFIVLFNIRKKEDKATTSKEPIENVTEQLNITVLLDLSDRISENKYPKQMHKDLQIINYITEYFKSDMRQKGAHRAKGKIKIIFYPTLNNSNINDIAKHLRIDLSKSEVGQKKQVYDGITKQFQNNLKTIYTQTQQEQNWCGSDIWKFFKDDVKDLCIDKNSNYRNILIILTDGYIYHQNSKGSKGNRYEYLLPSNIKAYREGNINKVKNNNFGLLSTRNDLQDLEVLVLEVNAEPSHPKDEEILKYCIKNWLNEMKVKRYNVYSTDDITENTNDRIKSFLSNN